MTNYIEDTLFLNFISSLSVFVLSQKIVGQKTCFIRTFFVSFICLIAPILEIFFNISLVYIIVVKIILYFIISCLLVERYNAKSFLFLSVVIIILSPVYYFATEFTKVFFANENILFFAQIFLLYLCFAIFYSAFKQFYKRRKLANFYYDLTINYKGKNHFVRAYLDSGNLLQDDETGLSILLLNFATFHKIFCKNATVLDYLQNRLDRKLDGKYINFSTVNSQSKMFVCYVDKVFVNGLKEDELSLLVGLSSNFCISGCDALLSPLAL